MNQSKEHCNKNNLYICDNKLIGLWFSRFSLSPFLSIRMMLAFVQSKEISSLLKHLQKFFFAFIRFLTTNFNIFVFTLTSPVLPNFHFLESNLNLLFCYRRQFFRIYIDDIVRSYLRIIQNFVEFLHHCCIDFSSTATLVHFLVYALESILMIFFIGLVCFFNLHTHASLS